MTADGLNPWVYEPSRMACWIFARLWFRLKIKGRDRLPGSGPFVLAANHQSLFDPILIGLAIHRTRFIARSSLADFRPLGWWLRCVGTEFIRREAPARADVELMVDTLRAGHSLVYFPEGTRTRDGSVGPFRRGVSVLVKKTGVPVIPAGLRGPFRALPRGRVIPRPVSCTVNIGLPFPPEAILAHDGLEELRRQVAALAGAPLEPSSPGQEPAADQVGAGRRPDSSDDEDSSASDR